MIRRLALPLAAAAAFLALAPTAGAATSPASWKPWLLSSPDQFRLGAPPSARSKTTKTELAQLRKLQRHRTPAQNALITKWVKEPSAYVWMKTELGLTESYRPRVAPSARCLAVLGTALEDAMIAADDSRLAYAGKSRPAPWKLDRRIKPAVKASATTSYAPYDAAMAGAAEVVLPYLYPAEPPQTFTKLANELIAARLSAGLNYRSDLQRARALGHEVAKLAIAHGELDNHGATGYFEGPFNGDEFWQPTPFAYEPAIGSAVGKWHPWVIGSPLTMLGAIPPPSPYGSAAYLAQINAVLDTSAHLTDEQKRIAQFWDDEPGTLTPPGHWMDIGMQTMKAYKTPPQQAVRMMAYLGVTEEDSVVAWFGLKYHYWQPRPITAIWRLSADRTHLYTEAEIAADPSLAPLRNQWTPFIPTPPFPSYPAGHPTFSGASARLLSAFFPTAGDTLNQLAEQVALARLYGGIHFPEDNTAGLTLGRAVADLILARANADGDQ